MNESIVIMLNTIIIIIIWNEYWKYDINSSGNIDYWNYLYILFIQLTKNRLRNQVE